MVQPFSHTETEPCWVEHLRLHNFRNYTSLDLETAREPVVLTGQNGAGKTNILEALSLLNPNKGIRRATVPQLQNFHHPEQPWAINARLRRGDDFSQINMGIDLLAPKKKILKINGTLTPKSGLLEQVIVLWCTPFMDQIFVASLSQRRKFLDRLVTMYDPAHSKRLAKLEHTLRERGRLLKERCMDNTWLSALEERIARESVAIITTRQHFLEKLNHYTKDALTNFPKAHCHVKGAIEKLLETNAALTVEDKVSETLHNNRLQDTYSSSASMGAHLSDLVVYHLDFNQPAEVCSTGEQKALLLSIIMAQARLSVELRRCTPLLLLDEVVAHLDLVRRETLFQEISDLKMQAWLTGTDIGHFEPLEGRAQFFNISHAHVHKTENDMD